MGGETTDLGLPGDVAARLREALAGAARIVVFSGAGASAQSGIATFRDGETGLWTRYRPEQLATPNAYLADPALVWGRYQWRRRQVAAAQPNAGHLAVARWGRSREVSVVTQNVDDLHERAGSEDVTHLHGEIAKARCFDCGAPYPLTEVSEAPTAADGLSVEPPTCFACGGRVRPGVVWFGEPLPQAEWAAAKARCRRADLLICLGTSAVVRPASSLPELAWRHGATIVQVNPNPTEHDEMTEFVIRGTSADVMPRLVEISLGVTSI